MRLAAHLSFAVFAVSLMTSGCKTNSDQAASLNESVEGDGLPPDNVEDLGLWRDDRPLVKTITIPEGDLPIADEWTPAYGYEYWLYSSAGGTGFLSHGQGYSPYGGGKDLEKCKAGQKRYCRVVCGTPGEFEIKGKEAWCAATTSELARRCMLQAGLTLKAIMDAPPPEWADYLTRNRAPSFYGWIDDGAALGYSGEMSTAPFRWNSFMKWAGSVTSDGTCTTPSLGQFIRLLREFDTSGVFRL